MQEREKVLRRPWYREAEVGLLALLVIGAYFIRAGELPIRGEEPTRAQTAKEMIACGDFLVPREQGEPFLIRPPLQFWAIAATCEALGNWSQWAVRFHSLLATLATTLLVYGYARGLLSGVGAFAAAAAFATMADVLQMGRQAETEALFILLLSAAFLVWHAGIERGTSDLRTYLCSYVLMALAMLTKGLQAPVYFVATISVYLVLTGQWRRIFSRAHLLGALAGAGLVLVWWIPYIGALGWADALIVWHGDPAYRCTMKPWEWSARAFGIHLVELPLEIVAGALPWSLVLLPYLHHGFRRSLDAVTRRVILFQCIGMAIALPPCWFPPFGKSRFFAPLLPGVAVLVGIVIERCAEPTADALVCLFWKCWLWLLAGIMGASTVLVLFAAWFLGQDRVLWPAAEPRVTALAVALACSVLMVLLLRGRQGGARATRQAVVAVAGFMAVLFAGVVMDVRLRRAEYSIHTVEQLKHKLPPGQVLVSLDGHVDAQFAYHYGAPFIVPRAWPRTAAAAEDLTYFVFQSPRTGEDLPFPWRQVELISLDRNHHDAPQSYLIIGQKLGEPPLSRDDNEDSSTVAALRGLR